MSQYRGREIIEDHKYPPSKLEPSTMIMLISANRACLPLAAIRSKKTSSIGSSNRPKQDVIPQRLTSHILKDQQVVQSQKNEENNVVCARGRQAFRHVGNTRLRAVIQGQLQRYSNASSKMEKSLIVSDIADEVRKSGGEFVRYNNKTRSMEKISERAVREKVGQGLRDALSNVYKSSSMAKSRRIAAQRKFEDQVMDDIVASHMQVQGILSNLELKLTKLSWLDEEISDAELGAMFAVANTMILTELKAGSFCVRAFQKVCA